MFRRVLIANRGEVALRVIRTCRALQIQTVAVYSKVDRRALHATAADRAIEIDPAGSTEGYLSVARLVDAARQADADAIHPGYGFLSESAPFAAACRDAGITFIGPSPEVIEKTGSKIEVRRLAESVGVTVVPGGEPVDQTIDGLLEAVTRVGYPALVKPAAGGGGKGMRVVTDLSEAEVALHAARREAEYAFGNGALYVERYLVNPRHIEIQVAGDQRGGAVHLFERDCSVQRRYQKVVEETPSPGLSTEAREQMCAAALRVVAAAGYDNVGTVEFLVDGHGADTRFYFLEMNTRLQVEHPITEVCLGVDLVHGQIHIAAGQRLPWRQADLVSRGHAIECRVYAEDPAHDFLPQAGRLLRYREPSGAGIRVDTGVAERSDVPVQYDPLLAKLVTYGATRDWARRRAVEALRRYVILGVRTNMSFLRRVLEHPRFVAGDADTGFVAMERHTLLEPSSRDSLAATLAAAGATNLAAHGTSSTMPRADRDPWTTLRDWR